MNKKIILQFIIFIFILSSLSCQKSSSSNPPDADQESYSTDTRGDTISFESYNNHAVAIIPEGALDKETRLSALFEDNPPAKLPDSVMPAGKIVNFKPDGTVFNKKVTLGIPYNDMNKNGLIDGTTAIPEKIGIKYYNESNREWEDIPVKNLDKSVNLAYFETEHFSTYLTYVNSSASVQNITSSLEKNEYFHGDPYYKYTNSTKKILKEGCINRNDLPCGDPWHLSIFYSYKENIIITVDHFFTKNPTGGYPAVLSEDGKSISFDAQKIFAKVKESGDARLWDWQCEFVKELTFLENYIVISDDDPAIDQVQDVSKKIYADIKAVDKKTVNISYGIPIRTELKVGNTLSIRFEARYNPDGT